LAPERRGISVNAGGLICHVTAQVGIVIPAFNASPWVGDCLRSLIGQTHTSWAAVIVDDGSTDDTFSRIREVEDFRIRAVRRPNSGVSAARNRGLEVLPEYDAALFLDADDWLAPNALARLTDALAGNPHAVAATGPAALVRADGTIRQINPGVEGNVLGDLLIRKRLANGAQVLLRRRTVGAVGEFLTGLSSIGEDWEYWVRVALVGPFAKITGEPVAFIRRMETGAFTNRMMRSPETLDGCIAAIFDNPGVQHRIGKDDALRLRQYARAEVEWGVGCARLNGGDKEGRKLLRQSVARHPSPKRLMLLTAAHCPPAWRAASLLMRRKHVTGIGYS
jgi:glycosyltransferase involved in cell wall biosynthesis